MRVRQPGRPTTTERFGREKIIDGFRIMARQGSRETISRKDLAAFLGITPALISYYFPERDSLLFEAMEGMFAYWHEQLANVAEKECENETERLAEAIDLLLAFFLAEGHAEDLYDSLVHQNVIRGATRNSMEEMLTKIVMQTCNTARAELVAKLIWGACRHSAPLEYDSELVRSTLVNLLPGDKSFAPTAVQMEIDCST